jgi:hypothetical protein
LTTLDWFSGRARSPYKGRLGAQTSAPCTTWHDDVEAQQSPSDVQAAPSSEQAEVQERAPVGPGMQCPPQHSSGSAQPVRSARQPPSGETWHRRAAEGGGGMTQVAPMQQSGFAPQLSPSAPHMLAAASHTPRRVSPALQAPEQQSAFDAHSSHSLRQPPTGAHRFAPSLCITQSPEQQLPLPPQLSPTCPVHIIRSLRMHMGSAAQ